MEELHVLFSQKAISTRKHKVQGQQKIQVESFAHTPKNQMDIHTLQIGEQDLKVAEWQNCTEFVPHSWKQDISASSGSG
jgi:hypothetical protein